MKKMLTFGHKGQFKILVNESHLRNLPDPFNGRRIGQVIFTSNPEDLNLASVCYYLDEESHEHVITFVGGDGGTMQQRLPEEFRNEIIMACVCFYIDIASRPLLIITDTFVRF